MENQNIESKPGVEANEPNRYAVLVGCNYPNTKKELQGCVNDVTRMQKTLLERFGFNQDNIHMLIDTDPASTKPTADNIKEALQSMVNKASPGDVLLFYFSGHGNHVARPDDETGFDECIVACDMVFIPDDYFRALVNQLPEGTSFTIISDSCLSGGLIDKEKEQIGPHHQPGAAAAKPSVETQPRLIKPEEVTDGLPDAKPGPKDKVHPDMGILLSGCQPDEASHDCPSDDDPSKSGGAFSNALQRALERHPGAISNRYLILETRRILMHQHIKQHPCLYCSDANAVATFLCQPKLKPISSSSTE